MSAFRILVVDDHPIFRFGLCSMLRSREGWEVCGEAADGRDAVTKCRQLKPDLLVLDICLPELNGVDAAGQILKHNPDQVILVLTAVDSEHVIRECLESGVRGWVFKSDAPEDLMTAVEAMQRQKTMFSSRVSDLIMDGYRRHRARPTPENVTRLSPREREVVQLVSEGKASKEIAVILNVSLATAETHRSNILRKLRLHSIAELVLYAVRNGIVHVQFPRALRVSNPDPARNRSRALSGYTLTKAVNSRANVVSESLNSESLN
jgi:DNA-binding NarL/FixJ family response regulator